MVGAVVGTVGVFILLNLSPSGFQWQVGASYDRLLTVLSSPQAWASGEESLSVRVRIWQNTLRMGEEHLIRGVGVGNWRVLYPHYNRTVVDDRVFSEFGQWGRAHNDYFQTFSELGIIVVWP